jgi:alpha-galactosidase
MITVLSEFTLGDMVLRYLRQNDETVGAILLPKDKAGDTESEPDCAVEPLVQWKLLGDSFADAFGCGITLRDSGTVKKTRFIGQHTESIPGGRKIITEFDYKGAGALHVFEWREDYDVLRSFVTITNKRREGIVLELLSSFALGMLSPFENGLKEGGLKIYRMRSRWANEGVMRSCPAEDLLLVPSTFEGEIYTVKYGHLGNKPTNNFIPFAGVEDVKRRVLWGAQLACGASWQMELGRRDKGLSISGGLADADFGAWMKKLNPGESFTSPSAYISACTGDIDDLCGRMVSIQNLPLSNLPPGEDELPVIFNEWCTSWGCPSEENMKKLTDSLRGWPIRYLVMDAGWYKDEQPQWFEKTGDWIPSDKKYPRGLKAVCDDIRKAGFIPGIWFELETCGSLSEAYTKNDLLLHRHGFPLICGQRKFWDYRKDEVWEYMRRRVIGLMKECGIGYIKVDSNESIGLGCDGGESLGEGLRHEIACFEEFFREMRREIPDLVIENCSAGGQRLVSNFMGISSVASFSDCFETDDLPIIAANLHRVILPRQSGVWCIVRKNDSPKHLHYKLASCFLGRICMSGDIYDLDEGQLKIIRDALGYYETAKPVIKNGVSRRYGPDVVNYRNPRGWQALVRHNKDEKKTLLMVHRFSGEGELTIQVPLPERDLKIEWIFGRDTVQADIKGSEAYISFADEREGLVLLLRH